MYLIASGYALYTATRPAIDAPWGPRVHLGPDLNGAGSNGWAVISPDDLELHFASDRPGGLGGIDIYVSTRATPNDPWGPPVNLGPTVNTAGNETPGAISPDGLILFVASNRPGGFGANDVWMTRRASKGAAWSAPMNLGPSFNTPDGESLSSVSSDGHWACFHHRIAPVTIMWMAPILPIVDFNGDRKVDLDDLRLLIDHWGTDDTLYDIGPFAWGDGKVDIEDLKVFIAEWEKQDPPALEVTP